MKIITICGSLKFKKEILEIAEEMELKENVMITPIISTNPDKDRFSKKDIEIINKMHRERIKISDAILVVDKDGYIGESTASEIEFAKSLNKEVIYYSKIKETNE